MNTNWKQFAWIVAGGLVTYLLWEKYLRPVLIDGDGDGGAGGAGGASGNLSASGGSGGSGSGGSGSGGAGGAGGAGASADYGALASAISTLAAGVTLPNIQSTIREVTTGDNELVAYVSGKRICVLAYAITGPGTVEARWRSGASVNDLWAVDLSAPSGNSGANLSTAWPGYLFATAGGDALKINVTSPATVSVTYWTEDV